tara:strand:+ start:642 stop:1397 length:756 start_codon:yes stop_codon:yes gene_type:complete
MKGFIEHIQESWNKQMTRDTMQMAMFFVGMAILLHFGYQIKNGSGVDLGPIILAGLGTFLGAYSAFYLQNQHAKKVEEQANVNEINNCLISLKLKNHFLESFSQKYTLHLGQSVPAWALIRPVSILESEPYMSDINVPNCLVTINPEIGLYSFNLRANLFDFIENNKAFCKSYEDMVQPLLKTTYDRLTCDGIFIIDKKIKTNPVNYGHFTDTAERVMRDLNKSTDASKGATYVVRGTAKALYPNGKFVPI